MTAGHDLTRRFAAEMKRVVHSSPFERPPGKWTMPLALPPVKANDEYRSAKGLRDPEDRVVDKLSRQERQEMMDKTIADNFPASDPPSSIPDPDGDSFGLPSLQEGSR